MRNKTQKKKDVQLKQNNRNYEITGIIMLLFGVFSFAIVVFLSPYIFLS